MRLPDRPRWLSGQRILTGLLVPLAIVLLAWQPLPLQPYAGLDAGWMAGLQMALHNGLAFGSQAIFTYGPLGFLSAPGLWVSHLSQVAIAYALLMRFVFSLLVFAVARRSFGAVIAFMIAVVAGSLDSFLLEEAVFMIAAVWALTSQLSDRRATAFVCAAGAFSALELLDKVSTGITLAALTVVLVLSLRGPRLQCLVAALGSFLVVLVGIWAAIGQPLSALPDYLSSSEQITLGYAPAMSIEVPGLGWQYPAAFTGLAAGLWAAWRITQRGPPRQRWGVLVLWIGFWFLSFKQGFVRHDVPHAVVFFGVLLGGFLAFHWRGRDRLIALLSIGVLAAFALAAKHQSLTSGVNLTGHVRSAVTQLHAAVSASRRRAIAAAGRSEIEAKESIDRAALGLLQGHTVAVWPSEIELAWAYQLHWDPLPVLQSYSAYTASLDRLDANTLASARAPQRILLQAIPAIDGRVLSFDEALTSRAMLCHYRELYANQALAILSSGPDRCSRPTLIERVRDRWGQSVAVPAPPKSHSLISVSIDGVGNGGLEGIESLFYKPAERFIQLDGGTKRRLVPGTASDGLPLRAAPGIDYPPPFNVAVGPRSITVLKGGSGESAGRTLTFSFYVQSVSLPPDVVRDRLAVPSVVGPGPRVEPPL